MSVDEFQVDQIVDHFGQVPENLLFDTAVSSDECRLFAVLTTYDYRQTGECYPSQEKLGKRLGWSLAKTKRVIRALAERGAVEIVRRRREPALYRLVGRMIPRVLDGSDVSHQEVLMAQNGSLDGSDSESVPLTNETKNERETRDDFDDWWEGYPRRVDKAHARAKYHARRKQGISAEQLIAARDHYAASVADSDPRFVKHAATFLNGNEGPWAEYLAGPPADAKPRGFDPLTSTRIVLDRQRQKEIR